MFYDQMYSFIKKNDHNLQLKKYVNSLNILKFIKSKIKGKNL